MSRNQRSIIPTDGKETARFVTSAISSFIQDRLLDRDRRLRHKDQCSERLAADAQTPKANTAGVNYSDQAVLANLDWGIDALEDAISTSNQEAKLARLDHAERLLHVCALLDPANSTAGVPNSYLSAWAHLHLAYLHRLRGVDGAGQDFVFHILSMFSVDPFFSRVDFAPELWESLFLPHMAAVVGWYSEARHRIVMDSVPDSADLSLTTDFDEHFFGESLILSMRPDQAEKLRELEREYAESLDEKTRMFAKYYREVVEGAAAAGGGGGSDSGVMRKLPPIAEPPGSPLHEVSRKIPDFVKFGPILPKSAGFAVPASSQKDADAEVSVSSPSSSTGSSRSSTTSNSAQHTKESKQQIIMETLLEENEDESYPDGGDVEISDVLTHNLVCLNYGNTENVSVKNTMASRKKNGSSSFSSLDGYSPVDSPKTPPKVSSSKPAATFKQESEQMLRLLSNRFTSPLFFAEDSPETNSNVSSPNKVEDSEQLQRYISSRSAPLLASPSLHDSPSLHSNKEQEARRSRRNSFSSTHSQADMNINDHVSPSSFDTEGEDQLGRNNLSFPLSEKLVFRTRPPKDFVCPITGQLFNDPVTLETGQTFERRAIEEWLKRGNTTCPITRQLLSLNALPQTNYVLKRLITSWVEQNMELAQEFSYAYTPNASLSPISCREYPLDLATSEGVDPPLPQSRSSSVKSERRSTIFTRFSASPSPTSVISQAASETIMNELKPYASCLCTSEDLQECEAAILAIARIWKDSKADLNIHVYLSKPTILNGFIEVLSASVDTEVLKTSIYVLSELVIADESVGETLTIADSDFDCLTALLINGLAEAVVLIYLLRPTFSQLSRDDLVPSLVQVIMDAGEKMDDFQLVMEPKDAAIAILEHILSGGDENSRSVNALSVISANGLPSLLKCLNQMEGRLSIVSILLSCMRSDKRCRKFIAKRAELLPVLELFHAGDDSTRSICIDFISELVCLSRRTFCNQVLQMIKDEGAFSTMHSILVYLQMAPIEQQPAVASLLLQLDLLVEPRKMSIYREEAIDAIVEALGRKDFPVCQIIALETLSSLSGRLSPLGDPMTEAWLLKIAGIDHLYSTGVKEGAHVGDSLPEDTMEEEEKATRKWEKRVAFVLCNHDNGAIFKALEDCFRSKSVEMVKSCLVTATWLTHMLNSLPETGVKLIATRCLLRHFVEVLQSSKNVEEKVLATLALKSFISNADSLKELGTYAKCIYKPLRKLKKSSSVVADTMKAIMNLPSVDATELWSCTELFDIDCTPNGEVLSLVHSKGHLFSSHSDGTIKVWDAGRRGLRLVQEVHEHSKAVTCLHIPSSGNKLYSGSQDKTIRVWEIGPEEIHSIQLHDVKETVQCLATNAELLCFASQGTGVKVYSGSGSPKHVNFSKNVKCVAVDGADLYCGCTGYSIQEVDLSKSISNTFYSGTRKLLGKQTIHALQIQDDILYAGGSSVDGTAGKAFTLSTRTAIGSFTTGIDIHCIALSSDFVFTGTRCGVIEVWLKERLTRVGSIKVGRGASTRVTALASDSDGEMLFSGSADGKIQVWTLE